jgi:glycerol-3-phosphate dehydrogenase
MLRRDLAALQEKEVDLAVIGGGISGACLAHDAALRGLSVALVEKRDFGSATSASSSKVLHGGIRYLQQLNLHRLRESALERCYFQRIAPHLTRYVPFLIPTYRGIARGRMALRTAVSVYDLLCAGQNAVITDPSKLVPRSRICTKAETLERAPVLSHQHDLTGACLIYESHMHSSERMTLAFVKSAARNGAVVANYLGVERLLGPDNAARGLTVRDEIGGGSFDIRARVICNAAGPWIPQLNRAFKVPGPPNDVARFSKGAHLVTRALTDEVALVLPTTKRQLSIIDRGGRHLFVIPWRSVSLIGTSNVPFDGTPDEVGATVQNVVNFLADINHVLPGANLTPADVRYVFAGLLPSTDDAGPADVYQAGSPYQIVDHARQGHLDRVITVRGAKYTTARRLAELAIDIVVEKLGTTARSCQTSRTPLHGGDIEHLPSYVSDALRRYASRLEEDTIRHLVDHYGTEIDALLASTTHGVQTDARVSPLRECIEAEVVFAVTAEMALHLDDVVFRRTGLGTIGHPGRRCLTRCAEIMAPLLGWSPRHCEEEIRRTEALLTVPTTGHETRA